MQIKTRKKLSGKLRNFLIAMFFVHLTGCAVLTSKVMTIGDREQYGTIDPNPGGCSPVTLHESHVKDVRHFADVFSDTIRVDDRELGEFSGCSRAMGKDKPSVQIVLDGKPQEFWVNFPTFEPGSKVEIRREFHTGPGKAAQLLALITVPADLGIFAAHIAVGVVMLPLTIPYAIYVGVNKARHPDQSLLPPP